MNILKGLDISCDILRWTLMIIWVVFSESVVNIYLALLSDDKSITIVSEVVISNTGKVKLCWSDDGILRICIHYRFV